MKTKTTLLIIFFVVGLGFSVGVAIVDRHWGWDSTGWLLFVTFICLVIMVVNAVNNSRK